MNMHARFLGFAFAVADFLFEVDSNGVIVFAAGAAREFAPEAGVGAHGSKIFDAEGAKTFTQTLKGIGLGERFGPVLVKLASGVAVNFAMFRLPTEGAGTSCALSRTEVRRAANRDAQTGLSNRQGFVEAAASSAEGDMLAVVNVPGLSDACAKLGAEKSNGLLARIGNALSNMGAKAAGRITATGFGVIADAAAGGSERLGQQIRVALREGGAGPLAIEEALISLKGKELSEGQRNLVVRYVVDKFASGLLSGGATDAAEMFNRMMEDTQERLRTLTDTVADGKFALAYQPIVCLKSGDVSHFEALARFAKGSAGETIQFAEELGISDAFDLAVAMKTMAIVESGNSHGQEVAFNVSGHTICRPSNFGLLAGLLARKRNLAKRVLIEITETAEITDFESAKKAIAALRAMGFRVGLDDFGAGSASINYLQAFTVDFVKFDGSLIRNIGKSERDDRMLGGLVRMCGDLGVQTVAEFLETEQQVNTARAMGFDKGQGHYFGEAVPQIPRPQVKVAVRRRGVQESWG